MSRTRVRFLCPRSRSQSGHRKIEHNEKVCHTKVTIRSEVKLCLKLCCSETTTANLMKPYRKIKQNEKVLCTLFRFLRPRSRSQSGQRSKSCLSNNSKTTEAKLKKLHRKTEHIEEVCHAQELGSHVPKIVLLINY